jgi:ABC-type transport system involved in cytochrome bd biosynthesis fused ATPase/permease subunit
MTLSKVVSGRIFTFDELGAALDASAVAEMSAHFREQTAGQFSVLISHLFSILHMVDQIAVTEANRRLAKLICSVIVRVTSSLTGCRQASILRRST